MSPVGRPRGQKTDNATVTVRVTHHERLQYETRARSLDLSISEWARLVLRRDVGMWTASKEERIMLDVSYQVQVKGEWAGSEGGWRPAIDGTLNQTGRPAAQASTFPTMDEAEEALSLCVAEGAAEDNLRIVELR